MKNKKDSVTTTDDTNSKKRPRMVREPKPKPKKGGGLTTGDIEDFSFGGDEIVEIRKCLLKWYDVNQRDLPWRRINDDVGESDERKAYAVWVSEIMLQQTRVQTVIDYFNRWMQKWPTLHHLAQASLEEVNEMWAGLGYYRRARFLLERSRGEFYLTTLHLLDVPGAEYHIRGYMPLRVPQDLGAKMVIEEGGSFPNTVTALRKVRGIGEYTAGAIASIAFKKAVPVVDGNVVRVIARLKTISANPKDPAIVKNFWKLAGELVDPCRPGDFNQALMELGAVICTPLNPNCSACPISAQCHALSDSRHNTSTSVTDYPTKVAKAKQRCDFSAISVVEIMDSQDVENTSESESKYLLVKRPDEGLLAGLWEFPSVPLKGEADVVTRKRAIDRFLKKAFNLDIKNSNTLVAREEIGEYVHIFSHIRLKMYIELLVLRSKGVQRSQGKTAMSYRYVDEKALATMGLTSGVRKVYTMVQKFKQSSSSPIPG